MFFSCSSNPECGWCQTDGICYLRTDAAKCTSNLKTVKCPGLCEALSSCQSCTQHGQRYSAKKSVSKVIDILRLLENLVLVKDLDFQINLIKVDFFRRLDFDFW